MSRIRSDRSLFRVTSVVGAAGLGAAALLGSAGVADALDPCTQVASTVTCTYDSDGMFVVPSGITSLRILAVGGNGAAGVGSPGGAGGAGAALTSDFTVGSGQSVDNGQTLTYTVGGNATGRAGGAHGGGSGGLGRAAPGGDTGGGGGGGATTVTNPSERIVVAPGGGGGGAAGTDLVFVNGSGTPTNVAAGTGGNAFLTGSDINGTNGASAQGGMAANGSSGGAAGPSTNLGSFSPPTDGQNGSPTGDGGGGGNAANLSGDYEFGGGGGGGAGYAGGGGGGAGGRLAETDHIHAGGGGGGAAGLSFTAGTPVSRVASDGIPRVVFIYNVSHQVSVSKDGTGTGTVTSDPAGINCGATCAASFDDGATVKLTATPGALSLFAGWSHDCTNTTGPCVFNSLSADKAVTATFNIAQCEGHDVTLLGTNASETLTGTSGPDVISGLGGNDTIKSLGAGDIVCGDSGNDKLYGGTGGDHLYGGSGNDTIYGGTGRDFLFGGTGAKDYCNGEKGDDQASDGCNTRKSADSH